MTRNQTIISSIAQLLVSINVILMAFGITAFEDVSFETIYTAVSLAAMVVAWAYGLWKNHNFTQAARMAQLFLENLKAGGPVEEELPEDYFEGKE